MFKISKLKQELVHHRRYRARQEAIQDITEYIEIFYNRQRRQARLGFLSPVIYAGLLAGRKGLVSTIYIRRQSLYENGYIASFNGKLRDELLNREIFTTLTEAKVLITGWRKEYNHVKPHSAKGYKPPAPEAKMLVTLTL